MIAGPPASGIKQQTFHYEINIEFLIFYKWEKLFQATFFYHIQNHVTLKICNYFILEVFLTVINSLKLER